MHIQTVLEQLGYPGNQVKVYLAALRIGETSAAEIAQHIGLPRTTVTELINEMHKHGLMNYYVRRGRKIWTAENPDKLYISLKEREAALETILPQLHAMRPGKTPQKPAVKYFSGTEEVKNIFNDIIATRQHMQALVSWDDIKEFFGPSFMDDFVERRYKHFLRIRLITPKTELSQRLHRRDAEELRQTRFLPPSIALRRISNFIYGEKVAMLSLNRKEPMGIVIEDPDIARAMGIYFESLWQHSSE
jgi:sugar-specific transcriptional regulator TrmB